MQPSSNVHQNHSRIRIQRYFCSPCRTTHSILPKNLMPICRWFLDDILAIIWRFDQGESPYSITQNINRSLKNGTPQSLSSILNLKKWLHLAAKAVETLTHEQGLLITEPPRPIPKNNLGRLMLTKLWPTWNEFTHAFSRRFYPKRFLILQPHINLTG